MVEENHPIESVQFNVKLFKIVGLWSYPNNYYKIYQFSILLLLIIFNVIESVYVVKNFKYYFEIIGILSLLPNTMASLLKHIILRWKLIKLQQLIDYLNQQQFQINGGEEKRILLDGIKRSKQIFLLFFTTAIGCSFILAILPLFFNKTDDDKLLPWPVWLPFDYHHYYELVYLVQVLSLLYLALNNIAVDTFVAVNLIQIGIQYDLLYERIQQKPNNQTKLIECCQHYQMILEYGRQLLDIFNTIILIQFICSVSVICITTFALSLMSPKQVEFLQSLCYEIVIFVQILLYCWYGNEISIKSERLHYGVFTTNWINSTTAHNRDLLILMMIVKRPLVLVICDLFPVNLVTFTGIVRSAFAYFNVLYNLRKTGNL